MVNGFSLCVFIYLAQYPLHVLYIIGKIKNVQHFQIAF